MVRTITADEARAQGLSSKQVLAVLWWHSREAEQRHPLSASGKRHRDVMDQLLPVVEELEAEEAAAIEAAPKPAPKRRTRAKKTVAE